MAGYAAWIWSSTDWTAQPCSSPHGRLREGRREPAAERARRSSAWVESRRVVALEVVDRDAIGDARALERREIRVVGRELELARLVIARDVVESSAKKSDSRDSIAAGSTRTGARSRERPEQERQRPPKSGAAWDLGADGTKS
jgi:hypothetical protein